MKEAENVQLLLWGSSYGWKIRKFSLKKFSHSVDKIPVVEASIGGSTQRTRGITWIYHM